MKWLLPDAELVEVGPNCTQALALLLLEGEALRRVEVREYAVTGVEQVVVLTAHRQQVAVWRGLGHALARVTVAVD